MSFFLKGDVRAVDSPHHNTSAYRSSCLVVNILWIPFNESIDKVLDFGFQIWDCGFKGKAHGA
jgi:hypothetical protein